MKTVLIFLLVLNFQYQTFGQENEKVIADSSTDNPTSSLETGVKGLVKIVHGFLNAVQSEDFVSTKSTNDDTLTFEQVEELIKDKQFGDLGTRWKEFVGVFGGFAACVVVGLIFVICMPFAACINCCCYCCCKKCGKASSVSDPKNAKCQRLTFGSILFLLAVLLLVGAIFAVISNEILHSKLENVNEQGPVGQIKTNINGIIDFANNTANNIVKDSIDEVESSVQDLIRIITDASSTTVEDIKKTIKADSILEDLSTIGTNANESADSLKTVQREVANLKTLQVTTETKLSDVRANLTQICKQLPTNTCPNWSGLSLALNFSGLDDLSNIKTAVEKVTDIANKAQEAKNEFNNVENKIEKQLNSTVRDAKTEAERVKEDAIPKILEINSTFHNTTKNLNITKELRDVDNNLKEYGDYIWYAFLGIPCLMILVVVFYFMGLLFGTCGERPGRGAPCCNKGAGSNLLCCGVICSYLFASILMLIVIIMFIPFGLLYTNGCRYLNDGVENIERFEPILNFTGINVASMFPDKKSNNLTIGTILRNCKSNQGIYEAFHLRNLFDIDTVVNMTKITDDINKIVAEGSNANLSKIDIIPADLETMLKDFSSSGITTINFTQYDVVKGDLAPNMSSLIDQLRNIQNSTSSLHPNESKNLGHEIENLQAIQDYEFKQLEYAMNNLSEAVVVLEKQNLSTNQNQTEKLIEDLKEAQNNFNVNATKILNKSLMTVQTNILDRINTSVFKIKDKVKDAGKCKEVYNSVQALSDAVCVSVLDRVNSIWFGLGWGLTFYIPCIVFALLTASLYQREIPYSDSFHQTRPAKKKKNKEESHFDNPDIDSYQGQGYDAYGGSQGDNIPLTGVGNGGGHRGRGDGIANDGYYSPERRSGGYPDYRHGAYPDDNGYRGGGGYPDHRQGGGGGYPDQRQGGGGYSPPPYNGHDDYPRHSSANKYRQY